MIGKIRLQRLSMPRFHPDKTQCFPSGTSSVVSWFLNFSDSTYFFHLTGARVQVKETAASSYLSSLLIPKSNLSNVGICIERQQLWTWSMKACHVRFVRSAWGKQRELVTPMMLTLSRILLWESWWGIWREMDDHEIVNDQWSWYLFQGENFGEAVAFWMQL